MNITDIAIEPLPFTIEIAETESLFHSALAVRQAAYARHNPEVGTLLQNAEIEDSIAGSLVLIARSKADARTLGSMRIHTNAVLPLPLEKYTALPPGIAGRRLAEATRLGIMPHPLGPAVRAALFKAFYLHCVQQEVDFMVITSARSLYRMYKQMTFMDIDPAADYRSMPHSGTLPLRAMYLEVRESERAWGEAHHPLFTFMFRTIHEDINLTSAASLGAAAVLPMPLSTTDSA